MRSTNEARTRFECVSPILSVADMSRSVRYYVEVLGFKNADWGNDDFTSVNRDGAGIYLSQGSQGQPGTWVWIGVEDVEALFEEYKAAGVTFRHGPENYPWAYASVLSSPPGGEPMAVDPGLLEELVCSKSKGELEVIALPQEVCSTLVEKRREHSPSPIC